MTVERIDAGYRASLHDHASSQVCSVEFLTLQGLAEALEAMLADPETVWRDFKPWKGRTPPKEGPKEST